MNERIRLPAQEWLGYDPERGDIHGYTFEQMREFAQLIIRECVDICRSEDWEDQQGWGKMYAHKIQKQFGIKP